ncbi:MAG: hypothetical protein ACKVWV_17970 [Planctomycetota bacterium]
MSARDADFGIDGFRCWYDGAYCVKAAAANGDPLDLGAGEIAAIVKALAALLAREDRDELQRLVGDLDAAYPAHSR